MEAKELTKLAVKALEDKKGEDIRVIDIHEVSVLADYFVIADGSNALGNDNFCGFFQLCGKGAADFVKIRVGVIGADRRLQGFVAFVDAAEFFCRHGLSPPAEYGAQCL